MGQVWDSTYRGSWPATLARCNIKVGACESIVIGPQCTIELLPPVAKRGIIGDILGPITGIITDAFNTFKGPLMEIVTFVMNNVLSGLITAIANAVTSIFPGIDGLADSACNIVMGLIKLIPEAAAAIKAVVDTTILVLDGMAGVITKDLDLVLSTVDDAFKMLTKLNNLIAADARRILASTASLFDGAVDGIIGGAQNTVGIVSNLIETAATLVAVEIETIPELLVDALADGVDDVMLLFTSAVNDILIAVNTVVNACLSVASTAIDTVTSQIVLAVGVVTSAINEAGTEAAELIQLVCEIAEEAPGEARAAVGKALNAATSVGSDTVVQVGRTRDELSKGIGKFTDTAGEAVMAVSQIVKRVEGMGTIFAVAILISVLIVSFMMRQDLLRYRDV